MKVYATMATYPPRHHLVCSAVESLLPQVDCLYVCNNDSPCPALYTVSEEHPSKLGVMDSFEFAHASFGDSGKFAFQKWWYHYDDIVWVTCDDDIVYPLDYVKTMVAALERYDYKAAVSFHGAILRPPFKNYRAHRDVIYGFGEVLVDIPAHVLGTGMLGFHSKLFTPPLLVPEDFPIPNMADLWFAKALQERRIPAVVAAHPGNWFKSLAEKNVPSIWSAGELPETTRLVQEIDWQLFPLPARARS